MRQTMIKNRSLFGGKYKEEATKDIVAAIYNLFLGKRK